MEFRSFKITPITGGQNDIYKVPYAGIIRQVQRVGCLIPLSFLKLPDFRLSQKIYYMDFVITIIKLPKKSGLRTVLFRRTLDEQQNKDRKSVYAKAQRIYRHDARKRLELLENSIDPDDSDSADAAHRNERR